MSSERRCCLCAGKVIQRTITLPTGEKLLTCPMHSRLDEAIIVRAWEATAKTKAKAGKAT